MGKEKDVVSSSNRGGDRGSRRHNDSKKDRARGGGGKAESRRHERGHRSSRRFTAPPPRVPGDFSCHVCGRNHWTVECPKVERNPEDYPLMDRKKGCYRCGERGHTAVQCKKIKYRCKECGGLHDTKGCVYDHTGEEWHEFTDAATSHAFYTNSDESQVQWTRPAHELDSVLWYCPACRVLNPDKYDECLKCRAARPATVLAVADDASSSSSSDSDDEESTTASQASPSADGAALAQREIPPAG